MSLATILRFLAERRKRARQAERLAQLERELDEHLERHRQERKMRRKAAERGHTNQWKRRGEQARAMFGGQEYGRQ